MELTLLYGPNPIFRKKAAAVSSFDSELAAKLDALAELLYRAKGVGIGANMAGLLDRIIFVDLQEGGKNQPLEMVNPEIIEHSEELQTFEEASLSFPGISAPISRPAKIRIRYQDRQGESHVMEAEGWLATVLQHEVDYLDGKTFLDHLSSTKRNMLLRKLKKSR